MSRTLVCMSLDTNNFVMRIGIVSVNPDHILGEILCSDVIKISIKQLAQTQSRQCSFIVHSVWTGLNAMYCHPLLDNI